MAKTKENIPTLTPLNFKEGKLKSYSQEKSIDVGEFVDKYDPTIFCRTCANVDPCLVPIFKDEGLDYNLYSKIEKYLPIQVTEKDDLPVHICYHCASTLIAWDTLIEGCVEAEKKLTLLKNSFRSKEPDEVEEVGELIIDEIDSDDEPLITKKSAPERVEVGEKRDILQEKNDFQGLLEPIDMESERPKRIVSRRRNKDGESHDENVKESERRRKCLICGKKVTKSLKRHMRTHHESAKRIVSVEGESSHKCPICRKTFNEVKDLAEDLYSHVEVEKLVEGSEKWDLNVCRICRKEEVMDKMPSHILVHIDSEKSKEDSERGAVKKKKKRESVDEDGCKSTCQICGKTISRKYAMKRHLATHSGEKKFTCHRCGKQYAQDSGLQRHVLVTHEGVRKYKCPICSVVFGSNSELKTHQDTHPDPRPFQCDQCGKTFISQKHLYHHRKYHHTANGMRQLCKLCNRYFSSPSVLRRHHKVVHLGLKEFQCHVCSAQLSTKHYLQEHLRLHSDERPEVCSFCGKTFQMMGNLRQHMKTHMGKTQICYACGKGFTRRCHLLIHMASHRGLEHPQCQHCNQVFLLKTDLEKHLKKDHRGKTTESEKSDV